MIYIQQGTLCTFEQDLLAVTSQFVKTFRYVFQQWNKGRHRRQGVIQAFVQVDRVSLVIVGQHEVVIFQYLFQCRRKMLLVRQIAHSQRSTAR